MRVFIIFIMSIVLLLASCIEENISPLNPSEPTIEDSIAKTINIVDKNATLVGSGNMLINPSECIVETTVNLTNEFSSFNFQIQSNSSEGLINVNSITWMVDSINAISRTIVSVSNEIGYERNFMLELKQINDSEFQIMQRSGNYCVENSLNEVSSRWRGWSEYFNCIGRILDTSEFGPGQVIAISGIAGGLGCLPCGAAGAFYFGVFALGCAG